jgi:hypothetical protein
MHLSQRGSFYLSPCPSSARLVRYTHPPSHCCTALQVGDEVAKEFGGMFGKDWQVEGFKKIVVLFAKEAKEEADDGVISIDIERHLLRGIRAAVSFYIT